MSSNLKALRMNLNPIGYRQLPSYHSQKLLCVRASYPRRLRRGYEALSDNLNNVYSVRN